MTFAINILFSIQGLLFFSLSIAVWLKLSPASSRARKAILLVVTFYLLASSLVVPHFAGRFLTSGYREFAATDVGPGRTVIVLLGARNYSVNDWSGNSMSFLVTEGATRTLEAYRVYRALGDATIISSGGAPVEKEGPSAQPMRDALVLMGIPEDKIVLEDKSRNTREEAVIISKMLPQLGGQNVVLVTSAMHMRRAIGAFRAVGINGNPAIARDPALSRSWIGFLTPSAQGLQRSSEVTHELLGLAAYWARGWFVGP